MRISFAILLLETGSLVGFSADRPAFEVASIKLHDPANPRQEKRITTDGINYSRVTIFECIVDAYHVAGFQVSEAKSASNAMLSERYDIAAKAGHVSDKAELMSMLQTLLADRFKLQFHRDTKELAVYLLVTGKKRLSIKQVEDQGADSVRLVPGGAAFQETSMTGFAGFLSGFGLIQRPVLDRTSLLGVFDFTLPLSDRESGTGSAPDKRTLFAWPSIFEDVQDLGLKLESAKTPVELLVIDHVEKASEN
jgi:uncharacterized protein (TIGR03435 family)